MNGSYTQLTGEDQTILRADELQMYLTIKHI
jgi:hypothetical protein